MSYVIAFVTFPESKGSTFPVECFRDDLSVDEEVIVRRTDGKIRKAIVSQLQYLNWDCRARIECKASEATTDKMGHLVLPQNLPVRVGLVTSNALIAALKGKGWIPLKRTQMYSAIFANANSTLRAHILIRRNGVDLQLLPDEGSQKPRPHSQWQNSIGDGRSVRHALAHTTFNLFKGICRFADSFVANEGNLDRYFVAVGRADKRTPELKAIGDAKRLEQRENIDELGDIYYAASSGDGGPAYLSDGVWITAGGSFHDWGR